ncbi:hypothetical protein ACIRD8_31595 [Streptomyces sp. NPDC102451]|uniref:hypothetical protein n=1 Tax=Streptomyces sp. NPDC102451 TaxID=3366177 RepID=UPI003811FBCF
MWWLRARRAHTRLPLGFLIFTLMAAIVQDTPLFLPSIWSGGSEIVQAVTLVPLVLTSVLFDCLYTRLDAAETTGIRPVRFFDVLLTLGVVALALALGEAISMITGAASAETLGRNTAFLAGLTLLCGALFGRSAVLVPALWPLIGVLFGMSGPGNAYPWTVLLEPPDTWYASTGALLMLILGIGAHLLPLNRLARSAA